MLCPRCGKNVGHKLALCDECQASQQAESAAAGESPHELPKETAVVRSSNRGSLGARKGADIVDSHGEKFGPSRAATIFQILFHPACLALVGLAGLLLIWLFVSFAGKRGLVPNVDASSRAQRSIHSLPLPAAMVPQQGQPELMADQEEQTKEGAKASFSKSQIGSFIDRESVKRIHEQQRQAADERYQKKFGPTPAPLSDEEANRLQQQALEKLRK
jgi:hypothetical protein